MYVLNLKAYNLQNLKKTCVFSELLLSFFKSLESNQSHTVQLLPPQASYVFQESKGKRVPRGRG